MYLQIFLIGINEKHIILRVIDTVGQFTDYFPAPQVECYTGIQNVSLEIAAWVDVYRTILIESGTGCHETGLSIILCHIQSIFFLLVVIFKSPKMQVYPASLKQSDTRIEESCLTRVRQSYTDAAQSIGCAQAGCFQDKHFSLLCNRKGEGAL